MFHLIGALPRHGKLGAICIGDSHATAEQYFRTSVSLLSREAAARGGFARAERGD